jgi:hypothetical protein
MFGIQLKNSSPIPHLSWHFSVSSLRSRRSSPASWWIVASLESDSDILGRPNRIRSFDMADIWVCQWWATGLNGWSSFSHQYFFGYPQHEHPMTEKRRESLIDWKHQGVTCPAPWTGTPHFSYRSWRPPTSGRDWRGLRGIGCGSHGYLPIVLGLSCRCFMFSSINSRTEVQ